MKTVALPAKRESTNRWSRIKSHGSEQTTRASKHLLCRPAGDEEIVLKIGVGQLANNTEKKSARFLHRYNDIRTFEISKNVSGKLNHNIVE